MGRGKDSIKCFLRVRPTRSGFGLDGGESRYDVDHTFDESTVTFHADGRRQDDDVVNHSVDEYKFRFDRVFDQTTTQEQVFDAVAKDCVLSVLDGYNSTVFAYGQTGSGKTHTITGGTSSYADRGIIPRAVSLLFNETQKRTDCAWSVSVSYLQIYNDKGQDLLNRGADAKTLDDLPAVSVHETDDEVVLRGLEAHPAGSVHDTLNLLFLGDTNRLYCETAMNKTSSRSHCIFTLMVEARPHGTAVVRRSKLNLVDLAGSERVGKSGATGTILTEAKYINLSLHYLEHVIVALAEQSRGRREHVPYRNSTMTQVLKDSLGGNCRTAMIATAHPGASHMPETVSTCRFAQRVASITQHAFVNEEQDPSILVRQLKKEVAALKDQVAFLSDGKDADPNRELSHDELERCREMVQRYVDDPDPKAQLTGVGADLARIMACFAILRGMVKGMPSPGPARVPGGATPSPPPGSSGGRPPTGDTAGLQDEVRRLQASVQQKENELTVMMSVAGKARAPRLHAQTQTGDDAAGAAGFLEAGRAPVPTAVMAASPQDRPVGGSAVPGSIMGQLRQRQGQGAGAGGAPALPTATEQREAQVQQQQVLHERLEDEYDLGALSDPGLLKDRAQAFERFRRSFRKAEQIERTQADIRRRMEEAKRLAPQVNGVIDEIKAAKHKITQLRTERALQGDPTLDPASEEARLTQRMQEELRPEYARLTKALAAAKEHIEHLQLMMTRARDQMIKDFEAWFDLRTAQLRAAGATAPAQATPSPPGTGSGGAASRFTAEQHQREHAALLEQQAQAGQITATALNSSVGPGRPVQALGTAVSAAGTAQAPGSAPGAPGAWAQTAPAASLPQGSAAAAAMSASMGGLPSTGNAAADAELARMYAARDERRRLLAQQPQ